MTRVFFLEPVPIAELALRRYEDGPCSGPYRAFHNADVLIGQEAEALRRTERLEPEATEFADDPRWPVHCACGHAFTPAAERQVRRERLYTGALDGQLVTLRSAPVGAMWDAHWMNLFYKGADGICLVVKTPGGDWLVDGRASNCTLPNDDVHTCWVRHGDPRTGALHVDKDGITCQAGAGSIQIGAFHGFLHHGHLVTC